MEEINNFQQEQYENLYQACAIPSKSVVDAKVAIHEMAEYSQKWHNGTSRSISTKTSDELAAIQAQLNNLGREIKKVNEKVYAAQVGYEQCKGPHYTKDFPLKEEGKTLKDSYYTQSIKDILSKFMSESAKRHEENSNLIKEIRALTDERGFGSLPSSTKANPRDKVKSISTTVEADSYPICHIGSSQSRAYRVFNKRTRVIMESIHVNFDELPQMTSTHNSSDPAPTCQTMASVQISSDPAPECQTMALEHDSLSPGQKCQENVSHKDKTDSPSNELDLLFSPMFDELLNGSTKVVSKSSAVSAADAPNQRQQPTTPLINHTTPAPTCHTPLITPSVTSSENITQAEPHAENDEVADDEFINIFSTPVQDQGEKSSRHVDSSNMHTFYQ
nr:hypothetical protein [Tanacetum cinerariifolium]